METMTTCALCQRTKLVDRIGGAKLRALGDANCFRFGKVQIATVRDHAVDLSRGQFGVFARAGQNL